MSVAYAMRDLYPTTDGRVPPGCVAVPAHRGGCGVAHEVVPDANGRYRVECERCAPALVSGTYGWSNTPAGVPLTPDEVGDRELAKRDAEAAQSVILGSITDSIVRGLASGGQVAIAPAPKSMAEQVAAMSDGDKAALRAMLGDAPSEPGEADEPARTGAPVKRGPGRPAKTAS